MEKIIVDYNGYNKASVGFEASYGDISGNSLAELAEKGIEAHGVMLDLNVFNSAGYPRGPASRDSCFDTRHLLTFQPDSHL